MHCKKCLHYDVCVKLGKPSLYGINQEIGCSAYKDKTKWAEKKEPENNADRFRSMSDEEQQKCVRRFWEIEDFADWLKQPAEE